MSQIRFEGLSKSYRGAFALNGIDLDVEPASLTVFSGPPGSGKSVLMRILIGLEAPSAGRILFDGQDITLLAAAERSIGYVPQSFALFPHMSVFDNIAYPMALQGVPRPEIAARVDQAAGMLRIRPLLSKRPSQLSGGEKQRAAIARGILKNADIFILDDPLVGLDFKLRESLMEDLKDMRAEIGATFLYVTADPLEALTMAEHLVVMDRGRVVEAGPVDAVYYDPTRLRTAELVGFPRCNILPGHLDPTSVVCITAVGALRVALEDGAVPSEAVVAIRPEDIAPAASGTAPLGVGEVTLVENLGSESVVYVRFGETTLVTTIPGRATVHIDLGDPFPFTIRPGGPILFDRASGRRIGRTTGVPAEMQDG
ncbi:MAG TPA: ABC transporter ATP-binding protein [Acetobacteraceae bacterium]|nr:ABC transporter ATP-binding protein [Acetobacteraceae bacterium]